VFQRHFDREGLASGQTTFDGRSDYLAFIDVGIPAGGLFTGAEDVKTEPQQAVYGGAEGEAFDPCYHQPCDDIENVSRRALGEMSDAMAHSVARFGSNLKFIPRPGVEKTSASPRAAAPEYVGDSLAR
jgi:Zn-dependent M28 family amino/carboxypeptidase